MTAEYHCYGPPLAVEVEATAVATFCRRRSTPELVYAAYRPYESRHHSSSM